MEKKKTPNHVADLDRKLASALARENEKLKAQGQQPQQAYVPIQSSPSQLNSLVSFTAPGAQQASENLAYQKLMEQVQSMQSVSVREAALIYFQPVTDVVSLTQEPDPEMTNRKFKIGDRVQESGRLDTTGIVQGYHEPNRRYVIDWYDTNTDSEGVRHVPPAPRYIAAQGVVTNKLKLDPYKVNERKKVSFDSVIVSELKRGQILEALEQIHQSDLIFEDWGFSDTIEKGKGVSILFYGPPGTGKTLMAQAIADHLDKKLHIVSTADIQSSAPGEAERNIREIFKKAKEEVLLFDECDSLIYSRAGVGAILGAQINELLSNLEKHEGISIFTTNRLGTLDEAVNRRLALKLEFDMPTVEERVQIWQRMFPKKAPLDNDINWEKLAGLEITGGYIKNAVLRAARMAAIEKLPKSKKKITMEHLKKALRLEAQSMIEFEKARGKHNSTKAVLSPEDYEQSDRHQLSIREEMSRGRTTH